MQIKSPNKAVLDKTRLSVFLAGSIEQGAAVDWQSIVVGMYPNLIFLNPRRENWDTSLVQDVSNEVFNTQVNWELDYLNECDLVFMYFQGDTKSPISLLELGYLCGIGKHMIVVCEPNFWRLGNVQVMANRFKDKVVLYSSLEEGLEALKAYHNLEFPDL